MADKYKKPPLIPLVIDLSRSLPHSEDIEKSTLGILMIIKGAILKVNGIIKEDTFYFEYHQVIYRAILNLFDKDSPIDTLLVIEELKRMGKLNGDTISESTIVSLTKGVVNDSSIEVWIRKLEEYAIARRNITIHLNAVDRYYRNEDDVFEIGDQTDTMLFQSKSSLDSYKNISMSRIGNDYLAKIERARNSKGITGIPTGLYELDSILGGAQPQTVTTIGALPAVGKSAVAIDFMYSAASMGHPVAFISMEMMDLELFSRLTSKHIWKTKGIKIEYTRINKGTITDAEYDIVKEAVAELAHMPIYIDDTPAINSMQLKSKVMKLIIEKGVEEVIVDYVQLMDKLQKEMGFSNAAEAISQNMRDLKKMSKGLNIPMIALSQVDRSVGKNGRNGKATMQDMKGSGGIEENSDVILLLDRPELYDPDDYAEKGMMHIVIAKHKNGEKGEIVAPFDLGINSFIERAFEDQSAAYIQKTGYILKSPPLSAAPRYEPRFNYKSTEYGNDDDGPPF